MSLQNKLRTLEFSKLFIDYRHRFIKFANTYLRDIHLSEDIVMDSFMYYWERRDTLTPDSNVPAYILTVIKHKCLNHLRSRVVREKAEKELTEHNEGILKINIEMLEVFEPQELLSEEIRQQINKAISLLPDRTKDIFLRSKFQNQTYKEIAEDLHTTVKSVEFEISKAMKILRLRLRDYYPFLLIMLKF